jgi:hypothetical protein
LQPTATGLITGLALGLAWTIDGIEGFLITAFLGVIGFIVGKIVAGEIDLTPYLGGRDATSSRRSR